MNDQDKIKQLSDLADRKATATLRFVDRAVTVSSGALAFSVTFRESIVGQFPEHLWLLQAAWIGFGISTICGVITHLGEVSALKRTMRALLADQQHRAAASAHPFYEFTYLLLLFCFPLSLAALLAFGVFNAH